MSCIVYSASLSASRHGVDLADAEHAVRNHRLWIRQFDEPRLVGGPRPELFIGPDRAGIPLEIMANWLTNGDLEVFHAMRLRQKTRNRVRSIQNG